MLDVRRLRVLREVARQGSLSAAATTLGYTQPAVSRQIAVLEAEVGIPLLRRLPHGTVLTDAGSLLVERTEPVLLSLDRTEEELRAFSDQPSGPLRVAAFASAAASVLPEMIARFRQRYPSIELAVTVADPPEALPQLRGGELDLVICNQHSPTPDRRGAIAAGSIGSGRGSGTAGISPLSTGGLPLEFVTLFDDPMYVALPVGHALAEGTVLSLEDLTGEQWMLATAGTCPDADIFRAACMAAGFEPHVSFQYDNYPALLGFVAAGVGIAIVPDMIARSARPDVVIRQLDPPLPARPVTAAVAAGYRSPAVTAMLDFVLELAPEWTAGCLHPGAAEIVC